MAERRDSLPRGAKRPQDYANDGTDENDHVSKKSKQRRTNQFRSESDSEDNDEAVTEEEELDDENAAIEAGQIVQVDLENFMCHRKFSIEFGGHLNFISGSNGSGSLISVRHNIYSLL